MRALINRKTHTQPPIITSSKAWGARCAKFCYCGVRGVSLTKASHAPLPGEKDKDSRGNFSRRAVPQTPKISTMERVRSALKLIETRAADMVTVGGGGRGWHSPTATKQLCSQHAAASAPRHFLPCFFIRVRAPLPSLVQIAPPVISSWRVGGWLVARRNRPDSDPEFE